MEDFGSWSVLTTWFLVILYLALGGVTLSSALHLVNGKWRFQVRRIACSTAVLFPLAFVLLLILLMNGESTFHWLADAHGDGHGDDEHHLPGWHNYTFLVWRQIIGFLVVAGLYVLFIKYQHASEVDDSYRVQRRFRNIALLIPFFYFAYGTMVAWDFEMTMFPGWHSASYGAYHFQSAFHFFLAALTIVLFVTTRTGTLVKPVEQKIFNYLAQFMLAMTILWTYLYFTQYLIMWYGRLPYDMDRYFNMMNNDLAFLWWTFLALKFVIPFLTLAITPNRHTPSIIFAVACCIVVGYFIERYVWIAGSIDPEYYHIPFTSLFDWVVSIVVVAAAAFSLRFAWNKYGLVKV